VTAPVVTNVADGDAHVAMQVGILHLDGDYQISLEASPEQIFRTGVRYLDARIPEEARKLVEEAVARGHKTTDEVHFYRLIALLSGRTLRHLDLAELDQLNSICQRIDRDDGSSEWAAGLRSILTLLDSPGSIDPELAVKKIEELPSRQRNLILDHLGVLRDGPLEDRLWQLSVERARAGQLAADRKDRVWIFFQPVPAHARVRPVSPFSIVPADWAYAILGGAAVLFAAGRLGSLVWQHGRLAPILAGITAIVGVVTFVVQGSEWHFRRQRIRVKNAEFIARPRNETAPADGFARRVDRLFDDYFGRYVPRETDRSIWRQQTAGIRQKLRDELVEIYREQGIKGDQIAWLIRHLVGDVRRRWENGTLTAYQQEFRTPAPVIARCVLGLIVVAAAQFWILPAAVSETPFASVLWTLLVVAGAGVAIVGVFRIAAEWRRVRADKAEYAAGMQARTEAYERWMRKLSRRPSDAEMAGWLECDRRILVDEMMRHYRLKPSQVIAHAFIEAPGRSAKRGRIRRGPWRYSRYQMLLFLLTDDGVRQVNIDLDFEQALSQRMQRLNYRFDTVAAVRVYGAPGQRQTFELTLFNGPPIRIQVTDDLVKGVQEDAVDAGTLSQVALDASGLPRTLDVLEGIAAEGKEWISRRQRRATERLAELSETIRNLME
jgi:hypothetical protein